MGNFVKESLLVKLVAYFLLVLYSHAWPRGNSRGTTYSIDIYGSRFTPLAEMFWETQLHLASRDSIE